MRLRTSARLNLKKEKAVGREAMWVAYDSAGAAHGFITKLPDTRTDTHPYKVFEYKYPWVPSTADRNPGYEMLGVVYVYGRKGLDVAFKLLNKRRRFEQYGDVTPQYGYRTAKTRSARKAVELVKIRGEMFERTPRFMIRFRGSNWGELYWNMRGYVAERGIPVPSSDGGGKAVGLSIGEKGLSAYKREISRANREWASLERNASLKTAALEVKDSKSLGSNRSTVARGLLMLARQLVGGIPNFQKFVDEYEVDDYPYGRFTTTAKWWVEGRPGRQRVVRTTVDPRTGRVSKPHKTTYGYGATIGLAGGRVYPIVGSPGQISVMKSNMKHSEGTLFADDPAYRKVADALGIRLGPKKVEVKTTSSGAFIDGLQGKETTIREILEIGGLSKEDLDDVDKVRRRDKFTESQWIVVFKSDRPDYVIVVKQ